VTIGLTADGSGEALSQRFHQARALHEHGKLHEAGGLYRQILAEDERHFAALLHLGTICLQEGHPEEALGFIQAAIEQDPNSAEAHSNLATALQVLDRGEAAIGAYEAALAIDSGHVEAYYGLANALQTQQRSDEAIACYQRALAIDPDYAEAHCGLGSVYHAQERFAAAIACYEKALEIDPDYPEALQGRGSAQHADMRYEEAATTFRRLLAIDPESAEAHRGLGAALQALDRYDEALFCYEKAVALKPGLAAAHARIGAALQELGRTNEAYRSFAEAVTLEPRDPRFHLLLIECRRVVAGSPELAALEEMGRDIRAFMPDARMHLHFALGKAFADVGDDAGSFRHYLAGNELKRAQLDYDEAAALRAFDDIRALFTPALLRAKAGSGHPSDRTIFIVGMPRSGSTLVEQILASHPEVYGGGERVDFSAILRSKGVDGPANPFPHGVAGFTSHDFLDLAGSYLDRMEHAAQVARDRESPAGSVTFARITDKTLNNFFCLGLIHLALPNARIVHTRRDPVDCCLSSFSRLFGSKLSFAYDLGELGRYYRAYQRLMEHWSTVLPPGAILDLQYEDVVDDLEGQARRLITHCGLEWNDACLAFHETRRPVKTASLSQVRQPIYRSSVRRWRPSGDVLRPLLDGLGIDCS
jgi:tetratricopeptide (TPR) repeat protein